MIVDRQQVEQFLGNLLRYGGMRPDRDWVHRGLRSWFADVLTQPFALDMVWLFVQPGPDQPFRQHAGYRLGGRPTSDAHASPEQQYFSASID